MLLEYATNARNTQTGDDVMNAKLILSIPQSLLTLKYISRK